GVPVRVGHAVDEEVAAVGADRVGGGRAGQVDALVLLAGAGRGGHEDGTVAEFGEEPGRRLRHVAQRLALVDLHAQQPGRPRVRHGQGEGGGGVDEGAVEVAGDEDGHQRVTALPSAPVAPRV